MSIHGICFDEGMSGRCGLDCRGFNDNECPDPEEILDNHTFNEIYDHGGFEDYLIEKFIPTLTLEIIRQQTKYDIDEYGYLAKLRLNNTN